MEHFTLHISERTFRQLLRLGLLAHDKPMTDATILVGLTALNQMEDETVERQAIARVRGHGIASA